MTGATSVIGHYLIPLLLEAGIEVVACSRRQRSATASDGKLQWFTMDMSEEDCFAALGQLDGWVHLAALPLAIPHLHHAQNSGIKRLIAFSSTSIYTKTDSSDEAERMLIGQILAAEKELDEQCRKALISWTLFRPTMIYGAGKDKNIGFIRSMINRFGVFPVIGCGDALRQPVHAEDLASACLLVMDSGKANNKAYNLSGGEQLSYRRMVERVFLASGKPAKIIHLPAGLIKVGLSILRLVPKYRYLNRAMVDRMQRDMIFSHDAARDDFAYSPRQFEP